MASTVTFKRGSTFGCTATYTPGAGPATLADVTIESDVIDSAQCVYSLTITKDVDNLGFAITYPVGTSSWNTGLAKWDLKFTYGGSVFYSETVRVNVIDQITD